MQAGSTAATVPAFDSPYQGTLRFQGPRGNGPHHGRRSEWDYLTPSGRYCVTVRWCWMSFRSRKSAKCPESM